MEDPSFKKHIYLGIYPVNHALDSGYVVRHDRMRPAFVYVPMQKQK